MIMNLIILKQVKVVINFENNSFMLINVRVMNNCINTVLTNFSFNFNLQYEYCSLEKNRY